MSFPYTKLPYGLRCRLRELASAAETCDLQIAVGNQLDGLKPIQRIKKVEHLLVNEEIPTTFVNSETDTSSYLDKIYIIDCHALSIHHNLSPDSTFFDAVYLKNTHELSFNVDDKALADVLLKKIAQMNGGSLHTLSLTMDVSHCPPLHEVLTLFPKLAEIEYPELYEGWATDLLKVDTTELKTLVGKNSELEQVFSCASHEMYQILKKGYNVKTTCMLTHTSYGIEAAFANIEKMIKYCRNNSSIKGTFTVVFHSEDGDWELNVPLAEDDGGRAD